MLIRNNINLEEALILDYIMKFTEYPDIKFIRIGGEKYYWISYAKILADLPILNIKKRRLYMLINQLIDKGILKKCTNSRGVYFKIIEEKFQDFEEVEQVEKCWEECSDYSQFLQKYHILRIGNIGKNYPKNYLSSYEEYGFLSKSECKKMHPLDSISAKKCTDQCKKFPPIVRYYNNKILIITDSGEQKIDFLSFYSILKQELKCRLSRVTYSMCFEDSVFQVIDDNMATISFKFANIVYDRMEVIDEAVEEAERIVRKREKKVV